MHANKNKSSLGQIKKTTTRWRARPDYHSRVCQARASERCVSASGFRCWQSALKNRKPSLRAQTHRGSRLLDTPYLLARQRVVEKKSRPDLQPGCCATGGPLARANQDATFDSLVRTRSQVRFTPVFPNRTRISIAGASSFKASASPGCAFKQVGQSSLSPSHNRSASSSTTRASCSSAASDRTPGCGFPGCGFPGRGFSGRGFSG